MILLHTAVVLIQKHAISLQSVILAIHFCCVRTQTTKKWDILSKCKMKLEKHTRLFSKRQRKRIFLSNMSNRFNF